MQSNKHWVEEQGLIQLWYQQRARHLPRLTPSPLPMNLPLDRVRLQGPGKGMLEWINGVCPTVPWETVHRICACVFKSSISSICNWRLVEKKSVWLNIVLWTLKGSIQLKTICFIFYINNSLHLERKYARIFIRGHYLFRRVTISENIARGNCELWGTDMSKDKYPSIF